MQVFTRCANYCKWSRYCGKLPVFFSVLRLLGSRQVVTQCLCWWTNYAMHRSVSRIGESRGSADHYAVQSPSCIRGAMPYDVIPQKKPETKKNQHSKTTKTQTQETSNQAMEWKHRMLHIKRPQSHCQLHHNTLSRVQISSERWDNPDVPATKRINSALPSTRIKPYHWASFQSRVNESTLNISF